MGRFSVLATLAAARGDHPRRAHLDAIDPARAGAVVGVAVWGADAVDDSYRDVFLEGKKRAHILTVPRAMPAAAAAQVSMAHGLRGPVFGVTSACASSNHALCAAVDQIRLGRADIMLAGGADAPITVRHPQGLGGDARPRPRRLPPLLRRPRWPGARRRRRNGGAGDARPRPRARRADPRRNRRLRPLGRCLRYRLAVARWPRRRPARLPRRCGPCP